MLPPIDKLFFAVAAVNIFLPWYEYFKVASLRNNMTCYEAFSKLRKNSNNRYAAYSPTFKVISPGLRNACMVQWTILGTPSYLPNVTVQKNKNLGSDLG